MHVLYGFICDFATPTCLRSYPLGIMREMGICVPVSDWRDALGGNLGGMVKGSGRSGRLDREIVVSGGDLAST